jgi:ATP-dependent DNA helicase RecG
MPTSDLNACPAAPADPVTWMSGALTLLPGIGPALAQRFALLLGGATVRDLLFHLPESHIDRSTRHTLRDALPGAVATVAVRVIRHEPPANARQPWRVVIGDDTGFGEITLFARPGQVPAALARLPPRAELIVSGKPAVFANRLSFAHPDHIVAAGDADTLPAFEPVWPLGAGLGGRHLRRAVDAALARLPDFPEWIDPALLRREGWPGFGASLRALHAPRSAPGPEPRLRLAYDELLARQIAYGLFRRRSRVEAGRAVAGTGRMRAHALARFGHEPTEAQRRVLREIDADMAAPRRMLRLLQGDVGAGKTLVALLAMLTAAEAGHQAALMAPTEILARQHLRTFRRLAPVETDLLAGSVRGGDRKRVLDGLASGTLQLVVGTHALFQSGVAFRDLALAVIDEQHRFGVDQRLLLAAKGAAADLLVMTATPIPRTLLLTHWGEMDLSRLDGRPAGRQPIRTTLHSLAQLAEVAGAVGRALDQGGRVYWVCPLVGESEALDIAAAEERHAAFRARFGPLAGLVHGRQDAATREAALAAFASGRTPLLVATTVVEVGVDVPEANVMVIDHAERFGLAQLHQLRGRVGRGSDPSYCLLLHDDGLSQAARQRLCLLRDTEDGFAIADADFDLRGPGEALGRAQSGPARYRLAHPEQQNRLLAIAHDDAENLLTGDPMLETPRGRAARLLLRLFDRDDTGRMLDAG